GGPESHGAGDDRQDGDGEPWERPVQWRIRKAKAGRKPPLRAVECSGKQTYTLPRGEGERSELCRNQWEKQVLCCRVRLAFPYCLTMRLRARGCYHDPFRLRSTPDGEAKE